MAVRLEERREGAYMEQQTFTRAEAERDVLIMAERLALLHYYFVKQATERYGEAEAADLARAAIAEYGEECGRLTRQKVEEQGLDNSLANHHLGGDLPKCGWQAELLAASEEEKLSQISYCPLAETWKRYGAEEWGLIYCGVDPAKYRGYNESLGFAAEKNMLAGDDCCLQRIVAKK